MDPVKNEAYLKQRLFELRQELVLFAHVRSEFGGFEYVFKGSYKVNHEQSLSLGKVCYDRISTVMPIYYPITEVQPGVLAVARYNNKEVAFFYNEEEIQRFEGKYKDMMVVERLK